MREPSFATVKQLTLAGSEPSTPAANVLALPKLTGIYSNMRKFPDSGDIAGMEVFILAACDPVDVEFFALVQFAEGVPEPPSLVKLRVSGRDIEFDVPDPSRKTGAFRGRVTDNALVGRFGNGAQLRLAKGKSFWQK